MVRTRSGFDSNEHASTNKGCCKRLLREFFLCMVDLSILMMGVLRAPLTMRVIVALVLRLLLYVTNGVALYALAATVLQNGRPAHPSGDDQFLADLVNALLQPAQYVNTQGPPPTSQRLRRSIGFHPHDLTVAEVNILRAIMRDPLNSFSPSEIVMTTTNKPTVTPTVSRMAARRLKAPSTAQARPGRAVSSTAPTVLVA